MYTFRKSWSSWCRKIDLWLKASGAVLAFSSLEDGCTTWRMALVRCKFFWYHKNLMISVLQKAWHSVSAETLGLSNRLLKATADALDCTQRAPVPLINQPGSRQTTSLNLPTLISQKTWAIDLTTISEKHFILSARRVIELLQKSMWYCSGDYYRRRVAPVMPSKQSMPPRSTADLLPLMDNRFFYSISIVENYLFALMYVMVEKTLRWNVRTN